MRARAPMCRGESTAIIIMMMMVVVVVLVVLLLQQRRNPVQGLQFTYRKSDYSQAHSISANIEREIIEQDLCDNC